MHTQNSLEQIASLAWTRGSCHERDESAVQMNHSIVFSLTREGHISLRAANRFLVRSSGSTYGPMNTAAEYEVACAIVNDPANSRTIAKRTHRPSYQVLPAIINMKSRGLVVNKW